MKTLNLTFEDKDFKKLTKIKDKTNAIKKERKEKAWNWEDFIKNTIFNIWK